MKIRLIVTIDSDLPETNNTAQEIQARLDAEVAKINEFGRSDALVPFQVRTLEWFFTDDE